MLATPCLAKQCERRRGRPRRSVTLTESVRRNTLASARWIGQAYSPTTKNGRHSVDIDSPRRHYCPKTVRSTSCTPLRRYRKLPAVVYHVIHKVSPSNGAPHRPMLNHPMALRHGRSLTTLWAPHALYLSWTYYVFHGTHDTTPRSARPFANGCVRPSIKIRLNFRIANVAPNVLLIDNFLANGCLKC